MAVCLATQSGPLFDKVREMAMALDGYLDVMRSPRHVKRADFDLMHWFMEIPLNFRSFNPWRRWPAISAAKPYTMDWSPS